MLGDSIIAQLARHPLPPPLDQACNLGRSGATAEAIAAIPVPASARLVFLEGGINDVLNGATDQAIAEAYRLALRELAGRQVLLIGILPGEAHLMRDDFGLYATPARISSANRMLLEVCAEHPHCRPAGRARTFSAAGNTVDGIHLAQNGHDELVRLMHGDWRDLDLEALRNAN